MRRALPCPELVDAGTVRRVPRGLPPSATSSCATGLVEPALDEAYLDVTEPKRGPPSGTLIARAIKQAIRAETGLTASAGVASGKFLAKVACGLRKPDGLSVILPEEEEAFLAALPVGRFFGVGPATEARMHALGLRTGADLRAYGAAALEREFGKTGRFFYEIACGRDTRRVDPDRERKSVGAETTFERDLQGRAELDAVLIELSAEVAHRVSRPMRARQDGNGRSPLRRLQHITAATPAVPLGHEEEILAVARRLLFDRTSARTHPAAWRDPLTVGRYAASTSRGWSSTA